MKSYLEQAFGRGDVTSARMQAAIREWLNLYYGTQFPGEDAADRLAVLVVSKLCRTVFAEYESRTAEALAPSLQALDAVRVQAMQYALVGGECLLKPVLHGRGFDFVPIRRDCYAPLGRDAHGALTGVGTMEVLRHDGRGYLLLERRTAGADGLIIEVHNNPQKALSDGAQSLTPDAFDEIAAHVTALTESMGRKVNNWGASA